MTAQTNLLLRLHKWATRQDQNFVTECLGLVLQDLLDREPTIGVQFLRFLTGGLLEVSPDDAASVDVRTQVETDRGRPDLELRAQGFLVVIEVKIESDVQTGQSVFGFFGGARYDHRTGQYADERGGPFAA